jgi:hypothetical protein
MNLFRAAIQPVSFCTSLIVAGAPISVMAKIFIGLASIARLLMMNPSNFPDGTPKTHLVGLSFHRNLHRLLNVSSKSAIRPVRIPSLDDHIIQVGFNVPMQLISKTHLNRVLIGCSYIFQPKRKRGDERGFDLIFLLECNLVIS